MNVNHNLIALYIRLSIEDAKVKSLSIDNQTSALRRYVETMNDVEDFEVREFIDNGYSGTNFERPAVQELLDLVQKGQVSCIIVKDFSRLGRNSIEVGYFMERVFPLYGVRFISINDDFDSAQLHGDTGGIPVAFKYLISEFYSRDLSAKYKSAKYTKFRRGEYQSKICPYGYRKGVDGRMEPNEETAENVRMMFELARDGCGVGEIARRLFELGIPTPGEYKAAHGFAGHDVSRCGGVWSGSTVSRILADERYIGTYVMGKSEVTEVGGRCVRRKPEDQWVKIPEHHLPIVSRELFEQVQVQISRSKHLKKINHEYPLKHKIFCGCCHHALPRTSNKNHAYFCRHSQMDETAPCHGLQIKEMELEGIVYQQMVDMVQDTPAFDAIEAVPSKESSLDADIADYQEQKRILYEQFALGKISLGEYKAQKIPLDRKLEQFRQTWSIIERQNVQKRATESRSKLLQLVLETGYLTAELADKLIDRVDVYPDGRVEVSWRLLDTS